MSSNFSPYVSFSVIDAIKLGKDERGGGAGEARAVRLDESLRVDSKKLPTKTECRLKKTPIRIQESWRRRRKSRWMGVRKLSFFWQEVSVF